MSDDLENYDLTDITPEDLGCLGEQENDPGVVEEAVGSGTPNQPISPCFEKIPFEKRKVYREIYDGFEKKDMSFPDFCVEMFALSSPTLMKKDLEQVISDKHLGNARAVSNKHAIDRSMN